MALKWRLMDHDGVIADSQTGNEPFICNYKGNGIWELGQDGSRLTMGSLQTCMKDAERHERQQKRAARQLELLKELRRLERKQIPTTRDQKRMHLLYKLVTPQVADR